MTFNYLIPQLSGTRWDTPASRPFAVTDVDWPRLGIYCCEDDPTTTWLVGSFVIAAVVFEKLGELHWGWQSEFMTGDGHLIRLGQRSGTAGTQYLHGLQVRDREYERALTTRAIEMLNAGEVDEAGRLSGIVRDIEASTRARISLQCGSCAFARVYRLEPAIHELVSRLWGAGFRELPLKAFAQRVDRRAKQPRC